MRTTLSIDDDIMMAARERAQSENRSIGEVVSDLARRGLTRPSPVGVTVRNGFHVMPSRGGVVTNELIERIRDEEGI